MSLLIKDAEMPKDCPMCYFAHWDKTDMFTGCNIVFGKMYAVRNDKGYAESVGRPAWCPLVEIKEEYE